MWLLEKFSDLISRSTGLILLLVSVLVAFSISVIVDINTGRFNLEIDPSTDSLLSEDSPAKQFYDHVREIFGSDETLVITLTSENIFTTDTLQRIHRMTQRIGNLESVHHVLSLSNAPDVRSVDDALDIAPFTISRAARNRQWKSGSGYSPTRSMQAAWYPKQAMQRHSLCTSMT